MTALSPDKTVLKINKCCSLAWFSRQGPYYSPTIQRRIQLQHNVLHLCSIPHSSRAPFRVPLCSQMQRVKDNHGWVLWSLMHVFKWQDTLKNLGLSVIKVRSRFVNEEHCLLQTLISLQGAVFKLFILIRMHFHILYQFLPLLKSSQMTFFSSLMTHPEIFIFPKTIIQMQLHFSSKHVEK